MRKPYVLNKNHNIIATGGDYKVLSYIMRYPERELSLSDLASEAGVAKSNMGKILFDLYSKKMIKIEKLSKIWRIKSNQKSPEFIGMKIVLNLFSLYQSNIVQKMNEKYNNPKSIILFGSFRKGEDISTSDIDIAIEHDSGSYKIIETEEKILGRRVNIHLFNRKNIDVNVFNNIANGIVLSGFLEVKL